MKQLNRLCLRLWILTLISLYSITHTNGFPSSTSLFISFRNSLMTTTRSVSRIYLSVPKEVPGIEVSTDLDIVRFLGKIDWSIDKPEAPKSGVEDDIFERYFVDNDRTSSITTVRIYEGQFFAPYNSNSDDGIYSLNDGEFQDESNAIDGAGIISQLGGSDRRRQKQVRCFMKEFLPNAKLFGQNEITVTKKLTKIWNNYQNESNHMAADTAVSTTLKRRKRTPLFKNDYPPFPILLAHGYCNEGITSASFREKFRSRFPRMKLPEPGNLWLVYKLDESSFRTMRNYPPLPQVVEGLDYFNKESRINKRWVFIRRAIRNALESIDFLHGHGYAHSMINIQSLWMTTTNQQRRNTLSIHVADLGACVKLSNAGEDLAQLYVLGDYYQLAFVFMEFIISSFCEDNRGARYVREKLSGSPSSISVFSTADEIDFSQLQQKEFQNVFERLCGQDVIRFRNFCKSVPDWKAGIDMLETNSGAAWKLILKMLANGSLMEEDRVTVMKVSGRKLIRDSYDLFEDTF